MYKEMKRMIISLVLSILLLTGETICVSAENIETIPFSMGQTLSGTVAENGTVYYQFSLSGKKTITLDATLTGGTIDLKIKDYNDKTYFYTYGNLFDKNSITGKYSGNFSVTLERGTYLLMVETSYSSYTVAYSIQTNVNEAGSVSGTSGTIKIGIKLKRKKSIQLTSILSGMSGKTTWKSSKKSVAKVSSKGKVTARKKGTATITARCKGKTAKIKVRVY